MKKQTDYYHYTECGLDNIYLVNGFKVTKTDDDEEEVFIHDIHGLHKAIANILIFKKGLLIGNEIKFIRTMLDLSQNKLAALIGCRYQQILLWEKDKNKISKPADRLLRIILYTYLHKEIDNGEVFDRINEIADLDAMEVDRLNKIEFKEVKDTWQMVA
jgi:DNA-binding transcriptional regulator YiaG